MINETLLGRYECHNGSSYKYWHVIFDKTRQVYIAQWGRINNSNPQGTKEYSEMEIRKKIKEKRSPRKGYSKVSGYQTTAGENSLHFIMSD